jgi:hypothetical protein
MRTRPPKVAALLSVPALDRYPKVLANGQSYRRQDSRRSLATAVHLLMSRLIIRKT